MRKCCGNGWSEWGSDSIFELGCKSCGHMVEFFKDEITRNCSNCGETVVNDRLRTMVFGRFTPSKKPLSQI